jgi:hypothetical protein
MTGWDFINHERKRLGIVRNWKSVTPGEVCGQLTAINDGRGKEWVEARCQCGDVSKYTASALKSGRSRRCKACDERIDAALAWKPPKKWRNPKPKSPEDVEIERVQAEKRRKKDLAKKDRHG